MTQPNVYANKPFLQNTMTQILAYNSNGIAWSGTVSQTGTVLTVINQTATSYGLAVNSIVAITGYLTVTVVSFAGLNGSSQPTWNVNIVQTTTANATATCTVTGTTWVGSASQTGTTLTTSTGSGTFGIGSIIGISGYRPVCILSGSGSTWTVNISQTTTNGVTFYAYQQPYTVQNVLNKFFIGVTSTNYDILFSAISAAENSVISTVSTSLGTAPNCGLRTLISIDDGSVAIDTSKTNNVYVNFNKKINIASSTVNSDNAVTVNGTGANAATLTIGTAGGNAIQENHMSRPEMLVATLSNNGYGYTSRFSSSVGAFLAYFAERVGLSTEEPIGLIRISVPVLVST